MSLYLSAHIPPADSIALLANLSAPATKEYEDAQIELERQRFKLKEKVLVVSSIFLVALGIGSVPLLGIASGIVIASIVILPIGASFILKAKRQDYAQKLQAQELIVRNIFSAMHDFLRIKRRVKEDLLVSTIPAKDSANLLTYTVNEAAALWNACKLDVQNKEEMIEHAKLRAQAKEILLRRTPKSIPLEIWENFSSECHRFLYGAGTVKDSLASYLGVSYVPYVLSVPYVKVCEDRSNRVWRLSHWD